MNKPIFIIIGAIIIFILVLVWAYLMFFGTPKNMQDIFADLNFQENLEDVSINVVTEDTVVNVNRPALRQLTTRLVAGFREIDAPPTADLPTIYYTEMGTGHIYAINLESGEETRISGTTVVGVNSASISPKGDYVAYGIANSSKNIKLLLGEISTSSDLVAEEISTTIDKFWINDNGNELLYTTREEIGLVAYSYNLANSTKRNVFSLPYHEALIQWGSTATAAHYVYPKPAYLFEGYLSEITGNKIKRLPVDGYGFSGLANKDIVAYSTLDRQDVKSYIYNKTNNTHNPFPLQINFMPEKCIISKNNNNLICAYDTTAKMAEFPDSWYQGVTSFKDSLWLVSGDALSAQFLVDTFTASNREIDITDLSIGSSERAVYFINKNDNTLWMYEL